MRVSAAVMRAVAAVGLADCLVTEAPPRPPARVPGRCPCGRTISKNKPYCRACAVRVEREIAAMRLADRIPDRAALEGVLAEAGAHRAEVLEAIRPYLQFEPGGEDGDA